MERKEIVLSVARMREADAYTIAKMNSSKDLMYRAGKAVYEACDWQGNIGIVCGSGNNAGDGYVLASLLWQAGHKPRLFLLYDKFSEDGAYYFAECKKLGIPYGFVEERTSFDNMDILVDCIYGTGFKGRPEGMAENCIRRINRSGAYVISVDINSGMDGDSGEAELCVRSDLTLSIGFLKQGQLKKAAQVHIGELRNLDIGILLPE